MRICEVLEKHPHNAVVDLPDGTSLQVIPGYNHLSLFHINAENTGNLQVWWKADYLEAECILQELLKLAPQEVNANETL
jgi:hypothetical protein